MRTFAAVPSARAPYTNRFVLLSVALPIDAMAVISFIQFTFRFEHINDRVTAMLTLMLTVAATKFSTDSYVPTLSCEAAKQGPTQKWGPQAATPNRRACPDTVPTRESSCPLNWQTRH